MKLRNLGFLLLVVLTMVTGCSFNSFGKSAQGRATKVEYGYTTNTGIGKKYSLTVLNGNGSLPTQYTLSMQNDSIESIKFLVRPEITNGKCTITSDSDGTFITNPNSPVELIGDGTKSNLNFTVSCPLLKVTNNKTVGFS